MQFSFDIDQTVTTALYAYVRTESDNANATINAQLIAADAYRNVPKNQRKAYRTWVTEQTVCTMSAESLNKRMGEAVAMLDKFGTIAATETAIDQYNAFRLANGGKFTFSTQFLASWLVSGKVHGADTVGKRVHGVTTEPTTQSENVTDGEADDVAETPSKGDVLTSILSMVGSLSADDIVVVEMALAAQRDRIAATQNILTLVS